MKICQKCGGRYEDTRGFCPRDGEVLVKDKDDAGLVGRTLDNQYEIEKFVAAGGMGAVYRARHILLGDPVAIKVLTPEMSGNAEWLKRFQREGQVARKFRHPNAVLVHDLRTSSDGLVYMVMEYVEGRTLDALLKQRGRFTPEEALDLLDPIASVLDAAHAMGVIHRDLKPENVMIGESTIKLLDLGIAKMREIAEGGGAAATSLTVAGQILGTPYYMSPEQWGEIPQDNSPEIDNRADIYSLGVMIYELVAGRKPFGGQTLAELRRGHVSFTPAPLHQVAPDAPEEFSQVIERAISKDRSARQSTAGKLLEEMRAALKLTASPNLTKALHPQSTRGLAAHQQSANAGQTFAADSDGVAASTQVPQNRSTGVDLSAPTIVRNNDHSPGAVEVNQNSSRDTVAQSASTSTATPNASASSAATNPNAGIQQYTPPSPTMATASEPMPTMALSSAQPPPAIPEVALRPTPAMPPSAPQAKRSAVVPIAIAVCGLLMLLVAGLGGWFVWNRFGAENANNTRVNQSNEAATNSSVKGSSAQLASVATTASATGESETTELAQWWLDVAPIAGSDASSERRAGSNIKVSDKEKFRLKFLLREAGYLYILGPDDKGDLTTFLTAKPTRDSGVNTNKVEKDQLFNLNWMRNSATEERYYVVFSPSPLAVPEFLASVAQRKLSSAEMSAWNAFLSQNKANVSAAAVKNGDHAMILSRFRSADGGAKPVVFDIVVSR